MNERITPFSRVDADQLRKQQPTFSADQKAAIKTAPRLLKNYLYHYGFDQLFEPQRPLNYDLCFHSWADHQIALHTWRQATARGTVMLAHGLFDHTGLYLKLVKRLLLEDYSVVSLDLPGHGLSSGERVAIQSFSQYSAVLAACLKHCQQQLPAPYFAVGQSTGAAAIMGLLIDPERSADVQKTVLLAPLVRVRGWPRILLAHALLKHFIKNVPRRFAVNSHDKNFLHFLAHKDPMQTRYIDVPWINAMHTWANNFKNSAPVDKSVFVIQGTADTTVDWRWNMPLIAEKFPQSNARYIESGLHHLVNEAEPWRGQIFDALCDYLDT